jgi:hypothetical protein
MILRSIQVFLIFTSSFLLSSCAGSSHPQLVSPSEGPIGTPRYLEIYSEKQIATLHFPAGVYTLSAVDKIGYYYRAPRKIRERLGGGAVGLEGGIFVSKRDPQKLRGYVYRAGTITHVGNFSHAQHRLFDQDIPASDR